LPSYPELGGRVVALTGGTQGIGAAAAHAFASQDCAVALLYHDAQRAKKVVDQLTGAGGRAVAIPIDITDEASVSGAMAAVVAEYGGLDVLVNSVGGYPRIATVEDMTADEWDHVVALNLRSVFLTCRAAIRYLRRSRAGRIINVASISGRTIHSLSSPAYAAAKAGVIQLTRFLAAELGPDGITSNTIAPYTTVTPRIEQLRSGGDMERIIAQVPLRRLAKTDDNAQAILFLASDSAAYINGVVLDVNGGRIMM
jgi:3-oxoacyl-[acyl-carrier protein] reductase